MAKTIQEALAEVQKNAMKQNLQEALPMSSMGPDKPVKTVKTGGGDYNVYKKGSSTANEFQSMYGAAKKAGAGTFEWQGRKYAVPGGKGEYKPPVAAPEAPKPEAPAAPQGSQSPEGNSDVDKGKTAAPVAPASSGEEGIAKADAISATDRAIENSARGGTSSQLAGKPLEADGSNATTAQFVNANRQAGAAGGTTMGTSRQLGTIAAAGDQGKAGDDAARASMPADQKAKIDSDAAARQAEMNAEREKNLAAQAEKRAAMTASSSAGSNQAPAASSSNSPSVFSKVKDFFTKPTETKVADKGIESESGPKKDKKKMSESALINSFLKLQETKTGNIFEAAKKAKKDYDGDGKIESGKDEYLGSKIAAAKKAGKMEEELKGDQKKIDANNNGKIDGDDFRKLRSGKKAEKIKAYRADRDKHGEMEEEVESIDEGNPVNKEKKNAAVAAVGAANKDDQHLTTRGTGIRGSVANKIRGREVMSGKDRQQYEEVSFSEEELAHFEAVIARKDQKGKEKGIGDVVDSADLTDEYINEMARGVKAGTKRGSYKGKAHKGGADAKGASMPDEEPKGVPHVLDQIRHGHEDEHGFKTITHPASSPEAPVTKKIHRSELHGFYDTYHNTEKPREKEKAYSSFLGKHFGDERAAAPTTKSVTTDLSKIEKSNLKGGAGKISLGGSKLVGGKK